MSRKKASDSGGGKFKRLLGWTVLMAIVFSAGLITGERVVRKQSLGPLVSVTDQVTQPSKQDDGSEEGAEAEKETTFAFFDQLTRKDDVALSSTRKSSTRKAEKKPAKEAAPAQKEANKKEANKKEANKKEAKKPAAKEKPEKAPSADKKPAPPKAPKEKVAPEEKAPEKQASAGASPSEKAAAARYTLQVAAHPDMDSAKSHMERLRKMGLEPHLISAAIPGKGKFYRVRVGKFGSMDEARSFQASLKRKNSLSTFVSPL